MNLQEEGDEVGTLVAGRGLEVLPFQKIALGVYEAWQPKYTTLIHSQARVSIYKGLIKVLFKVLISQ